jgi:4'-phosphopantetheinyl transferase EntD
MTGNSRSPTDFDPSAEPQRIELTQLSQLFAAGCVVEAAVPKLCDDQLFPEELACLEKSVEKRRAEFGTARVIARRALSRLGVAPLPLVPKPDRSPSWPRGVVGSITHTQGYCAVAVAHDSAFISLGVDAEQDKVLKEELIEMICTPAERVQLGATDAVVYFAAKEAFYKCQYPLTQRYLGFQDVELELDAHRGEFLARVVKPDVDKPAWLARLRGRFVRERGLVLCAMSYELE